MKLIKTLGNKPRAPATLTDMLIGGQVLPTCHGMYIRPQGCSQMSSIHDRACMNKGHVLPPSPLHKQPRDTQMAVEMSEGSGPHKAGEF